MLVSRAYFSLVRSTCIFIANTRGQHARDHHERAHAKKRNHWHRRLQCFEGPQAQLDASENGEVARGPNVELQDRQGWPAHFCPERQGLSLLCWQGCYGVGGELPDLQSVQAEKAYQLVSCRPVSDTPFV